MNDSTRVIKAIEQSELIIDALIQGKTDVLSTCRTILCSIFFTNNQLADIFIEIFPGERVSSITNYLLHVCRRPGYFTNPNDIKIEIENFRYIVETLKKSEHYQERGDSKLKTPKIFISHSSKDEKIVSAFVDLLFDLGLNAGQIFCTSVPGCGVLIDNDIYESLKHEFEEHQVHVIFMLSSNYYSSPACLNEMGAAWILQTAYTTILLPGFEFREIDGAVNPRQMAIKLDEPLNHLKEKLGQMKNSFIEKFNLPQLPDTRWENRRDAFINSITLSANTLFKSRIDVSDKAIQLLCAACDSFDGEIMKSNDLSGTSIFVGKTQFVRSQERKEVAEWEAALKELQALDLVEPVGTKGIIFVVTKGGYDFIESYTTKSST